MSKRTRKWLWLGLRLAVAAAALVWTFSQTEFGPLIESLQSVSLAAVGAGIGLSVVGLLVGAVRWRLLLSAYGAKDPPPISFLFRVYFVGLFYNSFLPGNVGGDVLRGFVTRRSFQAKSGAFLIVFVERLYGLSGLLIVCATGLILFPLEMEIPLSLIGIGALSLAATAMLVPFLGRRFGGVLPGRIGAQLSGLPKIDKPLPLLGVLALSVVSQSIVAIIGHLLIMGLDERVAFTQSVVIVPLAMAAIYFPFTVSGLGVREAAFVSLFRSIGTSPEDATAASVAMLAVQWIVALLGGLAHLLWPVVAEDEESPAHESEASGAAANNPKSPDSIKAPTLPP
ncbi:MAG: lysylphosphatidylglycerol synthase transmembrane domain-containing protein [Myxococcota bacterium]